MNNQIRYRNSIIGVVAFAAMLYLQIGSSNLFQVYGTSEERNQAASLVNNCSNSGIFGSLCATNNIQTSGEDNFSNLNNFQTANAPDEIQVDLNIEEAFFDNRQRNLQICVEVQCGQINQQNALGDNNGGGINFEN